MLRHEIFSFIRDHTHRCGTCGKRPKSVKIEKPWNNEKKTVRKFFEFRPLSASATSVCVIPNKGEYFVPKHLRYVRTLRQYYWLLLYILFVFHTLIVVLFLASFSNLFYLQNILKLFWFILLFLKKISIIWTRMQKSFFKQFKEGSLTTSNYLDLTEGLKEVEEKDFLFFYFLRVFYSFVVLHHFFFAICFIFSRVFLFFLAFVSVKRCWSNIRIIVIILLLN